MIIFYNINPLLPLLIYRLQYLLMCFLKTCSLYILIYEDDIFFNFIFSGFWKCGKEPGDKP